MRIQAFLCSLAVVLFSGQHQRQLATICRQRRLGFSCQRPRPWDGTAGTATAPRSKRLDVKANAQWLADHLKPFGWQYVVVDMEWFVTNPLPEGNSKTSVYSMDRSGRYTPPVNRFPSAANDAGFKPLADYVHSLGLKFGIHILRGIPKQAIEKNPPIEGSSVHATEAADTSDTCPWNFDNYGIGGTKPGAQAYYDSLAKLYASWDVDLIKVDCISSRPYKADEIRMLSTALAKAGRPITLSLSPGPAPLEKAEEMRKYTQMWRISNDIWDLWHSTVEYPQGLGDQFANVAKWAGRRPGHSRMPPSPPISRHWQTDLPIPGDTRRYCARGPRYRSKFATSACTCASLLLSPAAQAPETNSE